MSKSINLRPRLQAAADMISGSRTAADVGCDHGRLAAALIQQGRAQYAIASDISPFALKKAGALAEKCGISGRVRTVLSDGISHLSPGEADSIAITGVGGELIARILSASPAAARGARRIIIQPMGGEEEIRRYLHENGYAVAGETLALDGGRIYQIISAQSGGPGPWPDWFPPDEYSLGPLLFEGRDPLLLPLLERRLAVYGRKLERARLKGKTPEPLAAMMVRTERLIKTAREALR